MNIVEYKGYQGSVEYEDGKLYIQILHIDDTIIAECDHASKVWLKFKQLVEGYLSDCEALGRTPNPPFKGSFNVRVGEALHKSVAYAAARNNQSLNSWVCTALAQAVRGDVHMSELVRRYYSTIEQAHISGSSTLDSALSDNVWGGGKIMGHIAVRQGRIVDARQGQFEKEDVLRIAESSSSVARLWV